MSLIGLELNDAQKLAKTNDYIVREVCRDGKHLRITQDYRENRINIITKTIDIDGKISLVVDSIKGNY